MKNPLTEAQRALVRKAFADAGLTVEQACDLLNNASAHWLKERELRDEFAMRALAGVTSNPASGCNTPRDLAHWAYRCADAMMKARDA